MTKEPKVLKVKQTAKPKANVITGAGRSALGGLRGITPNAERDEEDITPVVDYGRMSRDELIDHFIDEGGLAQYLETQNGGPLGADANWPLINRDLIAFSRGYLTFSPQYLQDLYEMQKGRNPVQREEIYVDQNGLVGDLKKGA